MGMPFRVYAANENAIMYGRYYKSLFAHVSIRIIIVQDDWTDEEYVQLCNMEESL